MSGVGVAAVALWTVFLKHDYISLLPSSNYVVGTYVLLLAGLLAIIGGFLGCCGVWREQRVLILFVSAVFYLMAGQLIYSFDHK